MTKIAQKSLGRRLPVGSELVQVTDLFAIPVDERANVEVLLASPWSTGLESNPYWMCVERLLVNPGGRTYGDEASLWSAPSGMIVIARRVDS